MPASGTAKLTLRKQLRAQRRALSLREQQQASRNFFNHIKRQLFFLRANRIAFYSANDGELNPSLLLNWAQKKRKHCFLPILNSTAGRQLLFLPVHPKTTFRPNRFGIPEPQTPRHKARPIWHLDVVFLPLVGFDRRGRRLGMGGGYYDKTFSQLYRYPRRPLLIGIGHDCQEVESLPVDSWDVAVDGIITDSGTKYLSSRYRYWLR